LIQMPTHHEDRRAVQLHLRPSGTQALKRWRGPFVGVLPTALAGLDEATLVRLDKDLAKLVDLLEVDEQAAGKPMSDL
jgi:hypothetical protein